MSFQTPISKKGIPPCRMPVHRMLRRRIQKDRHNKTCILDTELSNSVRNPTTSQYGRQVFGGGLHQILSIRNAVPHRLPIHPTVFANDRFDKWGNSNFFFQYSIQFIPNCFLKLPEHSISAGKQFQKPSPVPNVEFSNYAGFETAEIVSIRCVDHSTDSKHDPTSRPAKLGKHPGTKDLRITFLKLPSINQIPIGRGMNNSTRSLTPKIATATPSIPASHKAATVKLDKAAISSPQINGIATKFVCPNVRTGCGNKTSS